MSNLGFCKDFYFGFCNFHLGFSNFHFDYIIILKVAKIELFHPIEKVFFFVYSELAALALECWYDHELLDSEANLVFEDIIDY